VIFVRDKGADARRGCARDGDTTGMEIPLMVAVNTIEELAHWMKDE
jgi:hypothetical protein